MPALPVYVTQLKFLPGKSSWIEQKVISGISKQDYVVTRVFNITQEELGDQAQKFTFKAIEDHRDDNKDVIETFNTLIDLVKDQPDNPAIYNLFKQKLKAFISLDEGILGGVINDFLGNEGITIIDNNEFVADIFVKPARSINFIGLTFVATRTGISFDEVIGTV